MSENQCLDPGTSGGPSRLAAGPQVSGACHDSTFSLVVAAALDVSSKGTEEDKTR